MFFNCSWLWVVSDRAGTGPQVFWMQILCFLQQAMLSTVSFSSLWTVLSTKKSLLSSHMAWASPPWPDGDMWHSGQVLIFTPIFSRHLFNIYLGWLSSGVGVGIRKKEGITWGSAQEANKQNKGPAVNQEVQRLNIVTGTWTYLQGP